MKYKLWNNSQYTETDDLPPNTTIVGVNGFRPISTRQHYYAAGWDHLIKETPEEILNSPAHFNQPFAEIIEL